MSKYGAKRTVCRAEHTHASMKEALRCNDLYLLVAGKEIHSLTQQPVFVLEINGVRICRYIADFAYFDKKLGGWVTEDVKGRRTPAYLLKKKLVKALHGIDILET